MAPVPVTNMIGLPAVVAGSIGHRRDAARSAFGTVSSGPLGARGRGQRQDGEREQGCEPAGHGGSSMATDYAGSMAEPHSPEAVSSRIAQIRDGLTLLADYL